ncbi:hypothetical protein K6M90_19555 [Rhizobium sp. 9T]|uniref:hypothetical protein n=1 Tax=Rhizobium TaxID=379 RepID=UPI001C934A49|nr:MULTISPECIES: hypothetical protein [Rhizobium]MBY4609839.1 hypothetical protein [Rhizobium croatiense]ULR43215.1 hypothetical protein MHI61_18600 [Rhizobium sp. K102]
MRGNVAAPQSFFYALFPSGAVHSLTAIARENIVRRSIFAAFVDFHFNSKALS